ncbi:MAG TPA: UDP-N-acetylmuramoyl-tripeptide--D-alanyl-D-alanine ligase, partial [Alphaproteobacteria bacterium]|nr:UDP-N-acetylmuramoyl-tripeptide--D-alanyl-D-alanine ligase [Alphaproteobacteria bacterium]
MLWTLSQIADLIGGRLEGADHGVSHVTQDSRDVQKGSLFVPLKAARDGHEFAARAQQSGAVGAFWASDHDKPEGLSSIHV